MASRFPGFPPEMISFFAGLEGHNKREWFQVRKPLYEEKVKAPMAELVEWVNGELIGFAPDHVNEPKRAIYRIYRDTRFSKNKTPYKTQIGAIFPRRGLPKHGGGGYYFHVSHREVVVAGGAYMPEKEELLAIRTHVAAEFEEFEKLTRARRLRSLFGELRGECLSRAPKGFSPDDPAAAALRHKQWYFSVTLDPELATTAGFGREVIRRFRALKPFVDFLNDPLLARRRERGADPAFTFRAPASRRRAPR